MPACSASSYSSTFGFVSHRLLTVIVSFGQAMGAVAATLAAAILAAAILALAKAAAILVVAKAAAILAVA